MFRSTEVWGWYPSDAFHENIRTNLPHTGKLGNLFTVASWCSGNIRLSKNSCDVSGDKRYIRIFIVFKATDISKGRTKGGCFISTYVCVFQIFDFFFKIMKSQK